MLQHALVMDDLVAGQALGAEGGVEVEQVALAEGGAAAEDVVDLAGTLDDGRGVVDAFGPAAAQGEPDRPVAGADAGLQGASAARTETQDFGQVVEQEGRTLHTGVVARYLAERRLVVNLFPALGHRVH